jgi:hypothetical protein
VHLEDELPTASGQVGASVMAAALYTGGGKPHMEQRIRPACIVQFGTAFDDETASLVEADSRRVLLVHVHGELASIRTGLLDETPPDTASVEFRREE